MKNGSIALLCRFQQRKGTLLALLCRVAFFLFPKKNLRPVTGGVKRRKILCKSCFKKTSSFGSARSENCVSFCRVCLEISRPYKNLLRKTYHYRCKLMYISPRKRRYKHIARIYEVSADDIITGKYTPQVTEHLSPYSSRHHKK